VGWTLSLPSITRKTDKGLPKYRDADESDVFILSGAEELVPVFVENPAKEWVREGTRRIVNQSTYKVERYVLELKDLLLALSDGQIRMITKTASGAQYLRTMSLPGMDEPWKAGSSIRRTRPEFSTG
jgi:hypothetical protein